MDPINYIECFTILADTLSFSATAKIMKIAQPSVSRQIKLLETELDTKLFIRDKHKVFLSESGREFNSRISPLVKELKSVITQTQKNTKVVEGEISLGSLSEVGQSVFMQMVLGFQKINPGINFYVEYAQEWQIIEKVLAGTLAFGIITRPSLTENVKSYKLFEERSILVTRTSNPKNLQTITNATFIMFRRDDVLLAQYVKEYVNKSLAKNIKYKLMVNSHKSMIDALLATDSYAVLPFHSVKKVLDSGKLRIASEKEISNNLYLIFTEGLLIEKKYREFFNYMLAKCKLIA